MAAIGIDLGTTFSCVAVFQHGKVEIIANGQGNRTTPSYVAYTETGRIIGDGAKSQATVNPKNTVFDSKRLIGRRFNDPQIQEDIKHWPFVVEDDGKGKPVVSVDYKNKGMKLYPEEISAAILKQLKETAEKYLGKRVENAVITVPAYFNDAQRQSTKEAGAIAELNVMRIINEPTAAALAYGFDEENSEAKTILIFDLGGGTFDVSILNIEDGIFEVKSTSGDTHLGGEDFTDRLVAHFVKEFRNNNNKDLTKNQKALGRLKVECERIKKSLSCCTEENIDIDSLMDGIDFRSKISRAKFEDLNEDLFKKVLEPVQRALKDAGMKQHSINDIVLVGGSSRIPKIEKLLQEFFEGKPLNRNINPDEAIAHGAAIQAAKMSGDESEALQDVILLDVTPLSLGIRVVGEMMDIIVPRNTQIPTTQTKEFTTHVDNQTQVDVEIFEGERPSTRDNNSLGKFTLSGIAPQKRLVPKIDVTFDVNVEGILNVTAVDRSGNNKQELRITNDQGRLSKAEIDRMTHDAAMFAEDDKTEKERVAAKLRLENICLHMKSELTYGSATSSVHSSDKERVLTACNDNIKWLEGHQDASKEEYEAKTENLTQICTEVFD